MDGLTLLEKIFVNYKLNTFMTALCSSLGLIIELLSFIISLVIQPYIKNANIKEQCKTILKNALRVLSAIIILLGFFNFICQFTRWFHDPGIDYGSWVYYGQTAGNKPEGYGYCYDKNRKIVYIGDFVNGKYEGSGKEFASKKSNGETTIYLL